MTSAADGKKRSKIDWAALEPEYRANILSNRQLADKYGCTETAIRIRAKRDGWTKDLAEKVRRETEAKLLRATLRTSNACEDRRVVEDAATAGAGIVLRHRTSIARLRGTIERLSEKVELASACDLEIGEVYTASTIADVLSRSLAKLIPLERQAFSLDKPGTEESNRAPSGLAAFYGIRPNT